MYQRDTCMDELNRILDKETMEECEKFINMTRESRHKKTLEWQRLKFERLCQKNIQKGGHSNIHQDDHVSTLTSDETTSNSNSNKKNIG